MPVWSVGEILLWSRKPVFTATDAAAAWLASPPHKAILLSRAYKDAGVGVVPGDPLGDPLTTPSVTMAVLFGQRRAGAAERAAARHALIRGAPPRAHASPCQTTTGGSGCPSH